MRFGIDIEVILRVHDAPVKVIIQHDLAGGIAVPDGLDPSLKIIQMRVDRS